MLGIFIIPLCVYLVPTSQKRVLGHLGLESQTVVSCLVNAGKNP